MAARRRVWFLFLWGAAALVAIGATAVAWQLERARGLIRQSLERRHGLRVSVGRVGLAWPPGHLVVEDLVVSVSSDAPPVLTIPRLLFVSRLSSLVRGSFTFAHATAHSPRVALSLDRPEDLSILLALMSGPHREREAAKPSVRSGPVVVLPSTYSVVGGRLVLRSHGDVTRELDGVSGRLVRRGGGLHVEITQPEMGRLTADIAPSGAGESEAKVHLSGGRVELPGLPPLTDAVARVRLTPDFVLLDEVHARSGLDSRVEGSARVRLRPPLRVTFQAVAPEWDLTPWAGSTKIIGTSAAGARAGGIPTAHAFQSDLFWAELRRRLAFLKVDGRVSVARLRLGSARFHNASAHLMASEGRWVIQSVRMALNGGAQRGYVILSVPQRSGELFAAGERLPLDVLSRVFAGGQPGAGGRATYSAQLRWRGLSWPEFRRSLSGLGVVRVDDGWLPADVRAGGSRRPLRYRELAIRFRVSAGRVVTDDLEIRGEPWTLRGSGRLDLDGKLTAQVASPPGSLPALQGLLSGDLSHPRLTILHGDF